MTILKGIFVYTLIFLGLVLGVGVILIGVMYLFPQVSVFGYKLYHGNNNGVIYEVVASDEEKNVENVLSRNAYVLNNLDAIEIKADRWNIQVVYFETTPDNANRFRVEFTRSITGFVSTETPKPTFSVTAQQKALTGENEIKNVLTFEVNEPTGAYFNRSAMLSVWIPNTVAGGILSDLRIESGSGEVEFVQKSVAELVEIGNPVLDINNVTIVDGSSVLKLAHTNILNKLNITSTESKFTVDRELSCDINLDCKRGKYEFKNITSSNNDAEIVVDAVNADIIFANVQGNLTLKTDFGFFRANTIEGSFSSLSHDLTDYNNACDIKIQKIYGPTIIQNDSGKIELGQVGKVETLTNQTDLKVDTNSGDLTIKNCFAKNVAITSKGGVIRLSNCLGNITATTTYGSVYVNYLTATTTIDGVSDAIIESAVSNLRNTTATITTGNGKGNGAIEVYDSMGVLNLNSKGSGKVVAHMNNVVGENNISSASGNVTVVVPESSKFWAKWNASKSAEIYVVTFESTEKTQNSTMENYDSTKDAVFMGGSRDGTVTTMMTIKSGNNLSLLSQYHYEIA